MRFDTSEAAFLEVEEVDSTQHLAARLIKENGHAPSLIFAHHQTSGHGRHGRTWYSAPGESLTASLVFGEYANAPKPWLIGMALACAAASVLHCQLQWPNDLLARGKKLGGVLTEVFEDRDGRRIPVVGLGINLNQSSFPPEIEQRAISLTMAHEAGFGGANPMALTPRNILAKVVERLPSLPEPTEWAHLSPIWDLFDATAGKLYSMPDGRQGIALRVGRDGELLLSVEGNPMAVRAAEAHFAN
ncbi:MAG: biotin--[acetyl-CoA-carboxylase] ligase [Armatimonadetes bacterium]|nr:biotin--[acetyl-CoA-carboxylase] ligase [Armatimonadota bacterium]